MTCENKTKQKKSKKDALATSPFISRHCSPTILRLQHPEKGGRRCTVGAAGQHTRGHRLSLSPCVCRYRYLWVDWHLLLLLYKTSSNSNRPYDRARALGDVRVTDVSSYISSNPYPRLRQSRGSETPIVDVNLF